MNYDDYIEVCSLLEDAYDVLITEANNADLLEQIDKVLHYPKEAV